MNPNKLQEEETKSSYLISSYEIKSHHNHHSQIVANNNLKNIFKIEKKKCIFYKETKLRIVADFYQKHACQRIRVSFLKVMFLSHLKVVNLEFYMRENHSSTKR